MERLDNMMKLKGCLPLNSYPFIPHMYIQVSIKRTFSNDLSMFRWVEKGQHQSDQFALGFSAEFAYNNFAFWCTDSLVHTFRIRLASIFSLSTSCLDHPRCWCCSGHLNWAAVLLNGSKTFQPVSSVCLETLCSEGSFPLTSSLATSARGASLTTSAAKGNTL